MGQGDFTQRVEEKYLKREDEIGILARSIRDIHHNMRHLIGHVQREADTLDETVGTAETALAKLADEIDSVSGITQELAAGNQETAAAAQEVNTMSGEIEEAAKGIAEHAQEGNGKVDEIHTRAADTKQKSVQAVQISGKCMGKSMRAYWKHWKMQKSWSRSVFLRSPSWESLRRQICWL